MPLNGSDRNQGIWFTTNGKGAICQYCKRTLEPSSSDSELAARREHHTPRQKGGTERVWACRKCDALKENRSPEEWAVFMKEFPRWWTWKIFKNER